MAEAGFVSRAAAEELGYETATNGVWDTAMWFKT